MSDEIKKPHIDYPCEWEYRIINTDTAAVREAVVVIVADIEYALAEGHRSQTGKYATLTLKVTVRDEAHRNEIFTALRSHPDVVTVI
jgi:uncharacterized protein